jgi:hypothetical protein
MEFRIHHSLSAAFAWLLASAPMFAGPVVKQFPLDERVVYEIPISGDAPTTLMFPSSLTAIEGANISATPDQLAPVLLAYTPGRTFFSVRALEPGAKAAVNVVWKNKTYVLRFSVNPEPYGSVTFYEDELTGRSVTLSRRVTPEVLLALLDRAKSHALIAQQYPEVAQQIECARPGTASFYKDFRVTVEEVFRFDPEDTVVFRVRLDNAGDSEVIYQPQRLAVRVGANVYYASIADASGIVPPKASTVGYFAITGTPRGGRANLSIKNRFGIIVTRVERDAKLIVPDAP